MSRLGGLFKKAHELSVLCSVDIAVIIFGSNKKLYEYSSGDMSDILGRYTYVCSIDYSPKIIRQNLKLIIFNSMKHHMSIKDPQTFRGRAVVWMTMMTILIWLPHHRNLMSKYTIRICSTLGCRI